MKTVYLILLLLLLYPAPRGNAHNLRQLSSRDGLSNSSVTCLFQDSERFLWVGTYDGLNRYDSRDIYVYKPDINNRNSLSSNVIRNIVETESRCLWINTKWGLNKLSQRTNVIEEYYPDFSENSYIAKGGRNDLYVFSRPNTLSFYLKARHKFVHFPIYRETTYDNVSGFIVDPQDTIWINHRGKMERYTLAGKDTDTPQVVRHPDFEHPHAIQYAFDDNGEMILVDSEGNLFHKNRQGLHFIKNLQRLIRESGDIGSIICDNRDVLIGFKTNGLVRLVAEQNYEPEKFDIDCGVFALLKDEQQDIIWIGTDGQGVYAWTKDRYSFNNLPLGLLPIRKKRQVRAVYADKHNTLWLGTKNNGIIRINGYDAAKAYSPANTSHYTTRDGLTNNAVFVLTPSSAYPVLWIGSDGPGLNYYSYADNRIHTLSGAAGTPVEQVHALCETGDSSLWVGAGTTLLKIRVQPHLQSLAATSIRPIRFNVPHKQRNNQIYSIYAEGDSVIWVGIRGNGVIRLDTRTEAYRFLSFDKEGIAPMSDILCVYHDRNKVTWLGTSYGLIRLNFAPGGEYTFENFNENDGLPNNTIHGIAEDRQGNLWLSSNTGLILFDPDKNTFRSFNHKTGLEITEFSDNAYYRDATTNRYFFGGVDGIVWIKEKEVTEKKAFTPAILFTRLRIFNREYDISEFEERKSGSQTIRLNYDQNFFAVSFVAMDFVNGENGRYSYKLEKFSDVWMDTRSNEALFTNIPPGNYVLKVRYEDGTGSHDNPVQAIGIVIRPPWYQTTVARLLYLMLALGAAWGMFRYIRRKYERRKASIARRLNEKYKEEMYEGKLRFFTNITHEFCTPLTLIYGPCERILHYENSDGFVKKYAGIIQSNTERLNSLIQEVIDFRRIETGNQRCHIQKLDISELAGSIIESFGELAERNHICLETDIPVGITWNSDHNDFTKIVSNLISNAFKYTPENGTIRISVDTDGDKLVLKVYNTGKGIRKEDIPLIFNRYGVLDNIKENSIKGLSSRNGLGLAICQSLVELLQGTVEVESEPERYARFIVTLPLPELTETAGDLPGQAPPAILPGSETEPATPVTNTAGEQESNRPEATLLLIDDNKELLWMLKDSLSDEYAILTAENGEEGLALLKQQTPDLIITDIMMPITDGITLTRRLKSNRHTLHIPLIILSARNTTDEKIEGIESGADAYIAKPFRTEYLRTVIRQLLKKQEELKRYYNSSASAFDFSGGQLLPNEDKQFLQTATELINAHIDDAGFGPDELAEAMQTSSRNLYRRFKNLNQAPPKDFIKEQRITQAAKLLVTTTLTIQEIMYRTAFANRSHFYKEFAKRYEQTPKEYRETHKRKDNSLLK